MRTTSTETDASSRSNAVEAVQRRPELVSELVDERRVDRGLPSVGGQGLPCRLGCGQAVADETGHHTDPGLVRHGVQAEAAGRPGRLEQAVALLPRAQQLG